MKHIPVDVKILDSRLHENMPGYATAGSAGIDLRACIDQNLVIQPKQCSAEPPDKNLHYVEIVEPFGSPGRCDEGGDTREMTACILQKVVEADYTVDVLQRQQFAYSISKEVQEELLRENARWLAQRTTTCSVNDTGGSIDQLTAAQCLLEASQARVAELQS
jgi:uncharacterized protein YecT (DUF1311 family)